MRGSFMDFLRGFPDAETLCFKVRSTGLNSLQTNSSPWIILYCFCFFWWVSIISVTSYFIYCVVILIYEFVCLTLQTHWGRKRKGGNSGRMFTWLPHRLRTTRLESRASWGGRIFRLFRDKFSFSNSNSSHNSSGTSCRNRKSNKKRWTMKKKKTRRSDILLQYCFCKYCCYYYYLYCSL